MRALLMQARAIKEQLSSEPAVTINISLGNLTFEGELNRSSFDALIEPLVTTSIKACRRAVRDAGIELEDISNVVMVGGSNPCTESAGVRWAVFWYRAFERY